MNRSVRIIIEILPWLVFLYCSVAFAVDYKYFAETVVAKDSDSGSGVVESLTFFVLVAGILVGFYATVRYWKAFPSNPIRAWVIVFILGCVYFAGEEVSWGQWYFQWETPEAFEEINRQGETNLHNASSWLNEKPRTLVEIWIIVSGLIVAAVRLGGWFQFSDTDWREWINPYGVGISGCVVFLLSKVLALGESRFAHELSNSEIRELVIAYLFAVYLLSVCTKLCDLSTSQRKTEEEKGAVYSGISAGK